MNGPCWGSSGMKKWDYVKITGERCGQREREEIVIEEMRVEFATNGWDGTQSELLKWCRRLFWWYPTLPHLSRNFRGQKRIFPFFLFKFLLFFPLLFAIVTFDVVQNLICFLPLAYSYSYCQLKVSWRLLHDYVSTHLLFHTTIKYGQHHYGQEVKQDQDNASTV